MNKKEITEMSAKAKKLVEDVEDKFKREAFRVVFARLLAGGSSPAPSSDVWVTPKAKLQKAKPNKPPSLELSSNDINALKQELNAMKSLTAQIAVLRIAKVFEDKGKSEITRKDIEPVFKRLHRASVSKLPIVKDFPSLIKDMEGKALWFERVSRGIYRISDAGYEELNKTE